MWLSGQQKRPADPGEGQVGTVTVGGGDAAVLLDSERRGLQVYSPAGYHWTPQVGQRVLVIRGEGETPAIVGVHGGGQPKSVSISADSVQVSGQSVSIGGSVNLSGEVSIGGVSLEDYIIQVVGSLPGGGMTP